MNFFGSGTFRTLKYFKVFVAFTESVKVMSVAVPGLPQTPFYSRCPNGYYVDHLKFFSHNSLDMFVINVDQTLKALQSLIHFFVQFC